jgi:hypothetical protein
MHGIVRSASVAVLVVAVTITTAAQTPQTTTPAPSSNSTSQAQAGTMTLTGCVERADQIAPAPVGATAGATVDSQTFVLIKAEAPVAAAASGTSGATGTSGTAQSSAPAGTMYRLDGDVAKIAPHVGHRVEIMGSFEQPTGTSIVGATPDPNNPGAPANPLAATVAPRLKVDAIKMIADLCPR